MAYRKTAETEEILKALEKNAEKPDFERIRCPLCHWSPNASSSWMCADADAPEYFYGGCCTLVGTLLKHAENARRARTFGVGHHACVVRAGRATKIGMRKTIREKLFRF
jgi:hypothetical protein